MSINHEYGNLASNNLWETPNTGQPIEPRPHVEGEALLIDKSHSSKEKVKRALVISLVVIALIAQAAIITLGAIFFSPLVALALPLEIALILSAWAISSCLKQRKQQKEAIEEDWGIQEISHQGAPTEPESLNDDTPLQQRGSVEALELTEQPETSIHQPTPPQTPERTLLSVERPIQDLQDLQEMTRFNHSDLMRTLDTFWNRTTKPGYILLQSKANPNLLLDPRQAPVFDPILNSVSDPYNTKILKQTVWVQETCGQKNLGRGSSEVPSTTGKNSDAIKLPKATVYFASQKCYVLFDKAWLPSGTVIHTRWTPDPENKEIPGPAGIVLARFATKPSTVQEVVEQYTPYTTIFKDILSEAISSVVFSPDLGPRRSLIIRMPLMGLLEEKDPVFVDDQTVNATAVMARVALLRALEEEASDPSSILSRTLRTRKVIIELCDEDGNPFDDFSLTSKNSINEEGPWSIIDNLGQ